MSRLLLNRSIHRNLSRTRAGSSKAAVVGLVRETYGIWERRAPIIPDHVQQLTDEGYKVVVQPSSRRIFSDAEYAAAGAEINEDLSAATVVLGVKQVPVQNLLSDRAYMFFSHTIKAQEENMDLLDNCISKNITLFDYECIVNPKDGKRMVAFGQFAGIVGMVDMFQGLGQRLLADGFSTPFLLSSVCYMKSGLDEVEEMVKSVGERIKKDGLNPSLDPIVFAFTGDGNVGQGAKRMFELLPVTMVDPEDLPGLMEREKGKSQHCVYGCYLGPEHLARRKDGAPFSKEDYYKNPSEYQGSFHDKIAPYTTVLVNGMYWDARFPRLLTTAQMAKLAADGKNGRPTLRAISDITCDLGGSLEFCENSTYFENPFYEWDPVANKSTNVAGSDNGVCIQGVDILPTALPRDASKWFGDHLMPILKDLLAAQKLGSATTSILNSAMITHKKALQKNFQYIQRYREERERVESDSRHLSNKPRRVVLVQGHLFDSKFINTAFDMAEKKGDFEIMDFMVVPNLASGPRESQVILGLTGDDEETVNNMYNDIVKLGGLLDVRIQELDKDVHLHLDVPKARANKPSRKVLLLGSGLVAGPVVDYLTRETNRRQVTIVSDSKEAGQALAARAPGSALSVELAVQPNADVNEDWSRRLDELIAESDLVISLLPPPFHPSIARRCIRNKSHMVTASYVSPEMATLHEEAKASGIVILNEMGLDPGIDHMSAMKLIDEAKANGAIVKSFSSVCGGLSSPASLAPDNPLQYSFSWSPAGVMSAALTPAKYLRDGKLIEMDGYQKLHDAEPFYGWPCFNLECSANRDSVSFGDIYGISDTAETVFRGTLRFEGWCKLVFGFTKLGLLDAEHTTTKGQTWEELLNNLAKDRGHDSPRSLLLDHLDGDKADKVLSCLEWLGATGELPADATNATTALVSLLSSKLSLKPGESDLVLMRHDFKFEYPNGEKHETFSSMIMFGDSEQTAMAKTVGLTAAIGANLVLEGHLDECLGLASPMLKEVYNPALERLELEGVNFLEKTTITK